MWVLLVKNYSLYEWPPLRRYWMQLWSGNRRHHRIYYHCLHGEEGSFLPGVRLPKVVTAVWNINCKLRIECMMSARICEYHQHKQESKSGLNEMYFLNDI